MAKGIDFERKALEYLKSLFEQLGFPVLEARSQQSGTQNGFDIRITFHDDQNKVRKFYFECKDYTSKLYWEKIAVKILELNTSRHPVDGFIAISPHEDLSNINTNVNDNFPRFVKFPIRFWTPESYVKAYFSLDKVIFEYLYNEITNISEEEKETIRQKIRTVIIDILQEKDELAANANISFPKELTLRIPRINQNDIVGRTTELQELQNLLFDDKNVVVVNGLGGIGKTTLAQGYLSKYYEDYKHVIWITQLTNDIVNDITNAEGLAESLSIIKEGKDVISLLNEILHKLKTITDAPNLLILDNADETLTKLKDLLPGQPDWHVLVTSRKQVEGFHLKVLDFLSPEQAIVLFKKHCTLINEEDQIAELVNAIDYHTLTIEILAKTAQRRRVNIEKLTNAIKDDLKSNVYINHKGEKIDKVRSYLTSIFNLSGLGEEETWLMKQFTCLPAEFHAYETLLGLINPEDDKKEAFADTITKLVEQGWVIHNTVTGVYKMHLIVKEMAVRQLSTTLEDIEGLMDLITRILKVDHTQGNPIDKFPLIPYGQALLNNFKDDTSEQTALLQNNLAIVLQDLGDYVGARTLLEKAMYSTEQNYGPDHPTTAVSYSNLALVLLDLSDYASARVLLEKAVHSAEKNFGPDHPITATSYSNLALVLKNLGQNEAARDLLEKAIHSDEQNFGSDHPSTAIHYSNLASVLHALGQYEAARGLLQKAMRSDEQNFGPNHPATAVSYSNLGSVLQAMGQYEAAKDWLQKAMDSNEQNLGCDHPSTAMQYSNLATVHYYLGDYTNALELSRKSLSIFKNKLPEGHPSINKEQSNYDFIKAKL
jgi:tetratricopeptide (TPR) repeat protein